MRRKSVLVPLFLLLALLVLAACGGGTEEPAETGGETTTEEQAPPAGEETGGIQIPEPAEGKFNVAFVYVGPIGDGGWTYAHNEGRLYIEEALGDAVHTAYLESVPEGADAERVIRQLARKGFDAIFTTSFGYMDATEAVAAEFPDVYFVHVSGFKKNDTNFANLFGAMEDMKYLAGMIAGARAKADGSNRVGYIAPFPIAEVIRLGNAIALGMRETCPECELDVRWIFTWFDPDKEREAAESMLDAGASVIITGADTPGPVQAAGARGKWGIAYDSRNACDAAPEYCLTVPYWNWGPVYADFVKQMMDGTWKPDDYYFDADSGIVGLYGFMEGQTPQPGVPEEVIPQVRETLDKMVKGEMTRFDIFTGPIYDNKGNLVVPEGVTLTQEDLEGLDAATIEANGLDREPCTICMNWLAEGFVPDAEIPGGGE
nr:BMP family ABC transporter substrate-binding protein [Ardenticatena sp.]